MSAVDDYANDSKTSDTGTDLMFLLSARDVVTYFPNQFENGRWAALKSEADIAYPLCYWLRTSDEQWYPYTTVILGSNSMGAIGIGEPTSTTTDNTSIGMRPAIWVKF